MSAPRVNFLQEMFAAGGSRCEADIRSLSKRTFKATTTSMNIVAAANLLNRNFSADVPVRAWVDVIRIPRQCESAAENSCYACDENITREATGKVASRVKTL